MRRGTGPLSKKKRPAVNSDSESYATPSSPSTGDSIVRVRYEEGGSSGEGSTGGIPERQKKKKASPQGSTPTSHTQTVSSQSDDEEEDNPVGGGVPIEENPVGDGEAAAGAQPYVNVLEEGDEPDPNADAVPQALPATRSVYTNRVQRFVIAVASRIGRQDTEMYNDDFDIRAYEGQNMIFALRTNIDVYEFIAVNCRTEFSGAINTAWNYINMLIRTRKWNDIHRYESVAEMIADDEAYDLLAEATANEMIKTQLRVGGRQAPKHQKMDERVEFAITYSKLEDFFNYKRSYAL